MNRQQSLQRVTAAENEYRTAALALRRLRNAVGADQAILRDEELSVAHVLVCQRNLEATYVVRLFAEFEASLRAYWRDFRKRGSWNTVGAETLIGSVAAYHVVPEDAVLLTNEVRRLRNAFVHQLGRAGLSVLSLTECASHLRRFLSFLPMRW